MSARVLHTAALFALPLIVALAGAPVWVAAILVGLVLLWRWALNLQPFLAPASGPELALDTISASHFVEKVRWCLDRLGLDYQEYPAGGVIGALFLGRTVPRLRFRTGAIESAIGNSPEILRYLWGRYVAERPAQAVFLEPTPDRLALERRIDRCGVDLQVWVYFHILADRRLTLHAWGCDSDVIPAWQKGLLRFAFPFIRAFIRMSFRITPRHHAKAVEHIEALLADCDRWLADGRDSLLGGDTLNYTDFAFAAISGLWLQPTGYGAGKADAVRIDIDAAPPAMQAEVQRWRQTFPRAVAFIERLYAQERTPATA